MFNDDIKTGTVTKKSNGIVEIKTTSGETLNFSSLENFNLGESVKIKEGVVTRKIWE